MDTAALIQHLDDAPSTYGDVIDADHYGLQHVAYWPETYQARCDQAPAMGHTIGQEGSIGGELRRFAHLAGEHDPGTAIEISDISGPQGAMLEYVRTTALDRDGNDPIGVVG